MRMLKRGIAAACLLLCLVCIWLMANGNFEKSPEQNEGESSLEETIKQIFTGHGSIVKVQKVDWGVEELP